MGPSLFRKIYKHYNEEMTRWEITKIFCIVGSSPTVFISVSLPGESAKVKFREPQFESGTDI